MQKIKTGVLSLLLPSTKGNKLQLEIGDPADLNRLQNVDSILLVFLSDLEAFHDSLADPLTVKRIDYLVEKITAPSITAIYVHLPAGRRRTGPTYECAELQKLFCSFGWPWCNYYTSNGDSIVRSCFNP